MNPGPTLRAETRAEGTAIDAAGLERGGDEARRSFLRMMSHELRTPLNSIIGFADILSSELHGPLGAPQYREYSEIIRTSGQRLLNLVNQALEIIRLESGVTELDIHPTPLEAAADDAIQTLAGEASGRDVRVQFEPSGPPLSVLADPKALRTIIAILVQNALTYSPRGGVVRVMLEADGGQATLRVRDDGEGLNPADVPRLMAPFEQGENALVRRSEGAGLGWPLARLLLKAMGGEFLIDPGPGRGLEARFSLPRAD